MAKGSAGTRSVSQDAWLTRRVKGLYKAFNGRHWRECFDYLDPSLRSGARVTPENYAQSLAAFREHYGTIDVRHIEKSLHLKPSKHQQDKRPFAYVYVFWQDAHKQFHLFRERWVKDGSRWYTRVAG